MFGGEVGVFGGGSFPPAPPPLDRTLTLLVHSVQLHAMRATQLTTLTPSFR